MARTCREDLCLQGSAGQSQVAHNVEEFMTGRLVVIPKLDIIENAFLLYFNFGLVQHLGDVVKLVRFHHGLRSRSRCSDRHL